MKYRVTWTVNIEADSAVEAARKALNIQRNPESIATCFMVRKRPRGKHELIDLKGGELGPGPDEPAEKGE